MGQNQGQAQIKQGKVKLSAQTSDKLNFTTNLKGISKIIQQPGGNGEVKISKGNSSSLNRTKVQINNSSQLIGNSEKNSNQRSSLATDSENITGRSQYDTSIQM